MSIKVEFINTCPCCDEHCDFLKGIAKRFPGSLDLKLYYAGKDFDYLPKYGPISRGTLIIDGKERYEDLSRKKIEEVISKAMGEGI